MKKETKKESGNCRIGRLGEDVAAKYLQNKGWIIADRNIRVGGVEIDIVAFDPGGEAVLVEVKSLTSGGVLMPEDNMTYFKMERLRRAATYYVNSRGGDSTGGVRIDCVCVLLPSEATTQKVLTETLKNCEIRHYSNLA